MRHLGLGKFAVTLRVIFALAALAGLHLMATAFRPDSPKHAIVMEQSEIFLHGTAGEMLEGSVDLGNQSGETVSFTDIGTSCGCISARLEHMEVEPNDTAVLYLRVSREKAGEFKGVVWIRWKSDKEDVQRQEVLKLRVAVQPSIEPKVRAKAIET